MGGIATDAAADAMAAPSANGAGREPESPVDAALYLAGNPDLRDAFDAGLIGSAEDHWRDAGVTEAARGIRPTLSSRPVPVPVPRPLPASTGALRLDAAAYLALNPDLARAIGTDDAGARRHWNAFGAFEGRVGPGGAFPTARRPFAAALLDRAFGVDLVLDVTAVAPEAVAARRLLAALRAAAVPVALRGFGTRAGVLVLEEAERWRGPVHRATVVAAAPDLLRQLIRASAPDRFDATLLIGLLCRAPLATHAPDWPVLTELDLVWCPANDGADPLLTVLRAVCPSPVEAMPIGASPLADRALARDQLGLDADADVTIVSGGGGAGPLAPGTAVLVSRARANGGSETWTNVVDERRDPWSGASLALAAADRLGPGRVGRSGAAPSGWPPDRPDEVDRVDAIASGRAPAAVPGGAPLPPVPSHAAAGRAIAARLRALGLDGNGAAFVRLLARRALADAPEPAARPASPTLGPDAPVLSLLVRDRGDGTASALEAELAASPWALWELCVARSAGAPADGAADRPAAGDGRVRVIVAPAYPTDGDALNDAARVATGTHLLPLAGVDDGRVRVAALAALAASLGTPGSPDVLVGSEPGWPAIAGSPRDRIEHAVVPPVAFRRALLAPAGGFAPRALPVALHALSLALVRTGAIFGEIALPPAAAPSRRGARPREGEGASLVLRAHLDRTVGAAGAIAPGLRPSTFRIVRAPRRDPPAPVLVVLLGGATVVPAGGDASTAFASATDVAGLARAVAAHGAERVVLLAASLADPVSCATFDPLFDLAVEPSVGAACPLVRHRDGTIAEAGLARGTDGRLACPSAGWPEAASGPGRAALSVRNVDGASVCLAVRRTLLIEVGRALAASVGDDPPGRVLPALGDVLRTSGRRLAYSPFAAIRLRDGVGVVATARALGQTGPSRTGGRVV